MKKNERKKDILKGLLMVAFAFAVVLVRSWLLPDNEVLEYIALFIGAFLIGRASRLLFSVYEASEQSDRYEPRSVRKLLVLAGIMVGLSALCLWLSGLLMDVPELAFIGFTSLMVAVVLLFMAMGRIKVGTDNENTTSTATEDENEGRKDFAETPLMRFFISKKGMIVISVVMGLYAVCWFVGPYIDPTMTPEVTAAAPCLGVICLLGAVGWPVLHKWLTKDLDR